MMPLRTPQPQQPLSPTLSYLGGAPYVPASKQAQLRWRLIQRNPMALPALPGDHSAEC